MIVLGVSCVWQIIITTPENKNWETPLGSEGCHVLVSKKAGGKNASVKESEFISAKFTKTTHFYEKTLHGRPLHQKNKTLHTCNKQKIIYFL